MAVSIAFTTPPKEFGISHDEITALPLDHFLGESATYHSSTPSLIKYLNRNGLKSGYLIPPSSLLEQRGAEWFGPTLLILSNLYNTNPNIFSDLIETVYSHVKNIYPTDSNPNLKFDIFLHKDKESQSTVVNFDGTSEHFPELLKTLENLWNQK
ncbi:hypothetical protein [Pseudomonas sp. BF-B-26]|uniref:hypothetical protein n=1 Tax=Pseudomonas sp. BF-B-26 TaxID=2832400 RepID=UPI001CBF19AA|nr:hypothetical protein [Pseudomonas sp. BF-B-26]